MWHENSDETGHLFEGECLGEVKVSARGREYLSFAEAMALVKAAQPWNPTDPGPRPANDLHAAVCEVLGVDNYSEVALYTAVGSPLDFYHGVDALIEWRGAIVTIDVTANPTKSAHKADFILWPEDFAGNLATAAKLIARQLVSAGRRGEMTC